MVDNPPGHIASLVAGKHSPTLLTALPTLQLLVYPFPSVEGLSKSCSLRILTEPCERYLETGTAGSHHCTKD